MTCVPDGAACRVQLLGSFRIFDPAGRDVTPAGRKLQAIVALLALAPDGRRSRVWVRDKLWSDRPEAQGGACLRQALSALRKALGPLASSVIEADAASLALRLDRVVVDLRAQGDAPSPERRELLEGLDVGDPEFEEWLTLERRAFAVACEERARAGRDLVPPAASGPQAHPRWEDLAQAPRGRAIRIGLVCGRTDDAAQGIVLDRLSELTAKCLIEAGDLAVHVIGGAADGAGHDDRAAPLPSIDYLFRLQLRIAGGAGRLGFGVTRVLDGGLVWTDSVRVEPGHLREPEPAGLYPNVRRAVDGLLQRLAHDAAGSPPGLVLAAVDTMFQLDPGALAQAERTLRAAADLSPSAQADAWLAFLITFRIGQRHGVDALSAREEARERARRALLQAPGNALVLALVAHVRAFLLGDYEGACGLYEEALAINPMQPLAWDLYAMTHAYVGRAGAGLACARWARTLGAANPYRYYFDTSVCITASLAGRHEEAIRAGRRVLEERPGFNSVLRFLCASYGHLGDHEAAAETLRRLARVEPGFSITALREVGYPLARTDAGEAFLAGLIKAGVPVRAS